MKKEKEKKKGKRKKKKNLKEQNTTWFCNSYQGPWSRYVYRIAFAAEVHEEEARWFIL